MIADVGGRRRPINLRAPYLRRLWLDAARVADASLYPFALPFLRAFDQSFDRAITTIVGENGTGKSTLRVGGAERTRACRRKRHGALMPVAPPRAAVDGPRRAEISRVSGFVSDQTKR